MNVFFARTRSGVDKFIEIKKSAVDVELWVNGGVDLRGFDLHAYSITEFGVKFDIKNADELDAALGTIEDHYQECVVWVEA